MSFLKMSTFRSETTIWIVFAATGQVSRLPRSARRSRRRPRANDERTGKIAPAPWVPSTRAGFDVGAFSITNIEFESIPGDVITVYGVNSPEAAEANSNHNKAVADFEGIAIHCAQNSPLCAVAGSHAKPDLLPDEPGGYNGFNGIFGNLYVQPLINPSGPVVDLDGNVIANVTSTGTFPGFDPTASQSLEQVPA
jgi:hypothetical protein